MGTNRHIYHCNDFCPQWTETVEKSTITVQWTEVVAASIVDTEVVDGQLSLLHMIPCLVTDLK